MATLAPAVSRRHAWVSALRPRTLWAGAAPVAVGTSVAVWEGGARAAPALAALCGALLLQVASNFANDVYDHERGSDGEDRLGPPRATQMGWIGAASMKRATFAVLAAAAAIGLYLVAVGGWPVALAGALAMLAAWAYTGGPWPLGYHGLGDLAVFVFFGLVAVNGTTYVQTLDWSPAALWASLPVGALATAILVVNNLRDIGTDARAGKRTLAVRIGARATRLQYAGLLLFAGLWPVAAVAAGQAPLAVGLVWLSAGEAWRLRRGVAAADAGALNPHLGGTARLLAIYCGLLSAGYLVSAGLAR
ncbi:MAG: 1,4-dihydroxy-2-naphthoate polyprenyltransferase [Myxococcota bacterium]